MHTDPARQLLYHILHGEERFGPSGRQGESRSEDCRRGDHNGQDSVVFPYLQGGALQNMIAGVAIGLSEADTPAFRKYQQRVLDNMQALVQGILDANGRIKLVGATTDNHLCLLDLTKTKFTGREAELWLQENNIICNRNTIPGDKPSDPMGIRLGTAFMTSKGWNKKQFYKLGLKIGKLLIK